MHSFLGDVLYYTFFWNWVLILLLLKNMYKNSFKQSLSTSFVKYFTRCTCRECTFIYVFLCRGSSSPVVPTHFWVCCQQCRSLQGWGWRWRGLSLLSSAAFPAFANRWHLALTREQPEQGLAHGTHTMVPVRVRRVSAPIHVEAERLKLNLSEDSSIASLLTANTLNTQLPQV